MLNKRLLIASAKKKEQRKVKLTIGRYRRLGGSKYGYDKSYSFGSLDVVPYWGTTNDVMKSLVYTREETRFDAPSGITAFVKRYTQGITSGKAITGDIYSMNKSEGAVRYLTFNPPRRLPRSKHTQTDLKYYVEEVPWEAQDAEQGNASNFCTRTRSKDHSRGLSQRRRRRGVADVLQLQIYGLRSDRHCPIVSHSSHRENSDVLYYPSKGYRGSVPWRNKRSRRHYSDSFGCRNTTRHVSRCPSTYSGQLHNQWIRVHVLNEKEALYA